MVLKAKIDDTPHPILFEKTTGTMDRFRKLRRRISQNGDGRKDGLGQVVVFCGSSSQEGVTTTLANLAVHAAEEGERVLMVDANFRDPGLHSLFRVPITPGLADVILGGAELESAARSTNQENLWVLPCGSVRDNPANLLKYPGMEALLEDMSRIADLVLFDVPAANQFIDAGLVGQYADQVYLVIRAEKTRWEVVERAIRELGEFKAPVKGAVLNRRKHYIPKWLYSRL